MALEDLKLPRLPTDRLTEKQRRVLTGAYTMGYYEVPRKTSIEQLARIYGLAPSTVDIDLRRAERRFLLKCLGKLDTIAPASHEPIEPGFKVEGEALLRSM